MRIYVGRWDLLPAEWEGEMHGLDEKSKFDIIDEVARQRTLVKDTDEPMNSYTPYSLINSYTPKEFEATFNNDLENKLNTEDYWIKIF